MKQLFLAALLPLAAFAQGTPEQAIKSFYEQYRSLHESGLPRGASYTKLSPFFSSRLKQLMLKAQAEQARCEKAFSDEKPPWIEGDMFSSSFEGFTSFAVGPKSAEGYAMNFEYVEQGQKYTWKDHVSVIQEGGRWLIDNVNYKKTEGFGNGFGANLKNSLTGPGCEKK